MATFMEKAAHLVYHMFPLLCLFAVLVVSHLGFDDGNMALIVPIFWSLHSFYFVLLRPERD